MVIHTPTPQRGQLHTCAACRALYFPAPATIVDRLCYRCRIAADRTLASSGALALGCVASALLGAAIVALVW